MTAISSRRSPRISPLRQWHPATWQDYLASRDAPTQEQVSWRCAAAWFTQQITESS